jgi:hypothetical protein
MEESNAKGAMAAIRGARGGRRTLRGNRMNSSTVEVDMKTEVIQLKGDQLPDVWRPAWEVCWAIVMDGSLMAGPYASEEEARASLAQSSVFSVDLG